MAIIRMVRHGEAAAGFSEHVDPGLSAHGRQQAERLAVELAPLGPLAVVSSPMARARETAAPLATIWSVSMSIEPRVSEIPSPNLTPQTRGPWLRALMSGTWTDTSAEIREWRDTIVEVLMGCSTDTLVVSHFISTNAAIGAATGSDDVVVRHLGHCSVTTFDTSGGVLRLVDTGAEAHTDVL